MNVEQIEQQIQQLPPSDVIRLAEWFNSFLASHAHTSAEDNWQETPGLVAELNRRLDEYTANPVGAVPFEPNYFENLKRLLADERAKKASAR